MQNVKKSDGTIATAEVLIGHSIIIIFPAKDGDDAFTKTVSLNYIYAHNADATYEKAIDSAAISLFS